MDYPYINENQDEIWKPTEEFPDYAISSVGRVKRIIFGINKCHKPDKIIRPTSAQRGYLTVILTKNRLRSLKKIHHLVTDMFIGKIPTGYTRHHKDGNTFNNEVSNLEILPIKLHRRLHPSNNFKKGDDHFRAKLTSNDVQTIRKLSFVSNRKLAKKFNVSGYCIWSIKNNLTWKHI